MSEPSTTRRRLLRSGLATASVVSLAGCFGMSGDGDGDAPALLDRAPAGSQVLLHADVSVLLDDDVLRSRINDLIGAGGPLAGGGIGSVSAALTDIEQTIGLDPREVTETLLFAGTNPDVETAALLWTEWDESSIQEALGTVGLDTEPDTYREHAIYHLAGETELGILEAGTYVLGTPDGVAAAIDVDAGETDSVHGLVRDGFEDAAAGAVRTSFAVPESLAAQVDGSAPVDPATVRAMTHGYGAYTDSGGDPAATVTVETETADAAGSLVDGLHTAVSMLRDLVNSEQVRDDVAAELIPMLDSVTISQQETAVQLAVGRGEDALTLGFALLFSLLIGFGSQPDRRTPQATFEFEYEPETTQLTITHYGGDEIPADALEIRGSGFTDADGVDMTAPGTWQGSTSGDVDGGSIVVAGDAVTVGATPEYHIRVIWAPADGDTESVLASDSGPER